MSMDTIAKLKGMWKKMFFFCSVAGLLTIMGACSKDNSKPVLGIPEITVIMSKLGNGNHDYCSLIYDAVAKWERNPNVTMNVLYPHSNEEATAMYHEWAKKTADSVKALMVVANGEYTNMVINEKLDLKKNQQVLAFEMTLPEPMKGVHTFEINHAGVAYLSGTMAALRPETCVIIGHMTTVLDKAYKYYEEGYKKAGGQYCSKVELSDNFTGFNNATAAYEVAKSHPNQFILPLAGLSNQGVFDYLEFCMDHDTNNSIMAAGVDVNCNGISRRIAFSYLINIDDAIDEHLKCWLADKPWPEGPFGLANEMTGVAINPDVLELDNISRDNLEQRYDEYFEEAKKKDFE